MLSTVKSYYRGSKVCVRAEGVLSEWFQATVGVIQGCVTSPVQCIHGWSNDGGRGKSDGKESGDGTGPELMGHLPSHVCTVDPPLSTVQFKDFH